jgi:ligand-binding SRPBCC domain-containing protein
VTLVIRRSFMPVSAEVLFELHMDPANLPLISPSFPPVRLLSPPKRAEVGDLQVIRLGSERFGVTWHARITRVVPGKLLEDVQERGPYRSWRHQHRVASAPGGSVLSDVVSFRLIPTPAGEFFDYLVVRPLLLAMFVVRHRKTRRVLKHHKS